MERFTLPEALKDTNTKLGENVQSLVRPLADPTVRAVRHPIPTARFLPCACVPTHGCSLACVRMLETYHPQQVSTGPACRTRQAATHSRS